MDVSDVSMIHRVDLRLSLMGEPVDSGSSTYGAKVLPSEWDYEMHLCTSMMLR